MTRVKSYFFLVPFIWTLNIQNVVTTGEATFEEIHFHSVECNRDSTNIKDSKLQAHVAFFSPAIAANQLPEVSNIPAIHREATDRCDENLQVIKSFSDASEHKHQIGMRSSVDSDLCQHWDRNKLNCCSFSSIRSTKLLS